MDTIRIIDYDRLIEDIRSRPSLKRPYYGEGMQDVIESQEIYTLPLSVYTTKKGEKQAMIYFEPVVQPMRKNPGIDPVLPLRATKNACAYDLVSPVDFTLNPKEQIMIWTDVKIHLPSYKMLMINVRSSMGKKHIMLGNSSGWIDGDYYSNPSNDGNIGLLFYNYGDDPWEVHAGDRIAQGMIVPFFVTDDDSASNLRTGGFGSTDK